VRLLEEEDNAPGCAQEAATVSHAILYEAWREPGFGAQPLPKDGVFVPTDSRRGAHPNLSENLRELQRSDGIARFRSEYRPSPRRPAFGGKHRYTDSLGAQASKADEGTRGQSVERYDLIVVCRDGFV
jgi:hypothetical protein